MQGEEYDDEDDVRQNENLIDCMEESDQHRGLMLEASIETRESHGFQIEVLCQSVIAGTKEHEEGQLSDAVLIDFYEELKPMDEWIAKPKICEAYMEVVQKFLLVEICHKLDL
jgi:hypothetical protein